MQLAALPDAGICATNRIGEMIVAMHGGNRGERRVQKQNHMTARVSDILYTYSSHILSISLFSLSMTLRCLAAAASARPEISSSRPCMCCSAALNRVCPVSITAFVRCRSASSVCCVACTYTRVRSRFCITAHVDLRARFSGCEGSQRRRMHVAARQGCVVQVYYPLLQSFQRVVETDRAHWRYRISCKHR